MPTPDTAAVYPGMVLFEGTNVSEGRGTTRPFEWIGAPYIDPYRLIAHLKRYRLPGTELRAAFFEPTFHKWAGQLCGGVQIHVLDHKRFQPYRTAVMLLHGIARLWPREFAFRSPPYEYETERMPIDLITGGTGVRTCIETGSSVTQYLESSAVGLRRFGERRRKFLLYKR
jgi:uncharacterized protein YbbC (DUF1343 family)